MLLLTSAVGEAVATSDGVELGRLIDVTVRLDGARPRVRRIVVGARGHGSRLPRWDMVGSFEQGRVELRPGALPVAADTALDGALEPDELLLVRDVLDTQIVDVDRHRVARVAEVLLERDAAGALTVAGVEIGLSGVLRRLGLRRLASRLPRHAI